MFPVKGETLDPTKFRRFMPRGESAVTNWYDGPRQFVLFDDGGQLHLAHWLMDEGRLWRYVVVPTDIQRVSEVVANGDCVRRLLNESGSVFVVDVDVYTLNDDVAWVWRANIADIPEDCLPAYLPLKVLESEAAKPVPATIEFCTGDIFESGCDYLVNPVNCVGVMGKGLALEFRKRFPRMFAAYAEACRTGQLEVGHILIWNNVVCFPTKRHWRDGSELIDISNGLVDLVDFVREDRVRSIAVPALGCGLGGLEWQHVKPLIQMAFEELTDVRVVVYEPE